MKWMKYHQPWKWVLLPEVLQLNQKVKEALVTVWTEIKLVQKTKELIRITFKQHFFGPLQVLTRKSSLQPDDIMRNMMVVLILKIQLQSATKSAPYNGVEILHFWSLEIAKCWLKTQSGQETDFSSSENFASFWALIREASKQLICRKGTAQKGSKCLIQRGYFALIVLKCLIFFPDPWFYSIF